MSGWPYQEAFKDARSYRFAGGCGLLDGGGVLRRRAGGCSRGSARAASRRLRPQAFEVAWQAVRRGGAWTHSYDFAGSACEGYALQFRQVSEIDSGEGKVALSDLRAATWEDGDAKSFRFNSENKVNEHVVDTVDGSAGRDSSGVSVKLVKPQPKNFDLDAKIVFPTEHVRRVIEAAEAGKTCWSCRCSTARNPATRCSRPLR